MITALVYCDYAHDKESIENNFDKTLDQNLRIQFDRYIVNLEKIYLVQFESDRKKKLILTISLHVEVINLNYRVVERNGQSVTCTTLIKNLKLVSDEKDDYYIEPKITLI